MKEYEDYIIRDYSEGDEETGVVVTNMTWRLPLKTSEVKDALYYTMGYMDIF